MDNSVLKNKRLSSAKVVKDDEYYTLYEDIELELGHYGEFLRDKVIYLNCDDYRVSNFYRYFKDNFLSIGYRRLVATFFKVYDLVSFSDYDKPRKVIFDGEEYISELEGDGSFDSDECLEILRGCDVVVTNPPFSLLDNFIGCLDRYDKDFIILGHSTCFTKGRFIRSFLSGELFLGFNNVDRFIKGGGEVFVNCNWFTTFNNNKPANDFVDLVARYDEDKYRRYVNYDAINVDRVSLIPVDYYGWMGVPFSFLYKVNFEQFEVLFFNITSLESPVYLRYYEDNRYSSIKEKILYIRGVRGDSGSRIYFLEYDDRCDLYYAVFWRLMIKRRV